MRLTGSKNVLHFRLKCSKLLWFLGLCPRPRWGSLRRSPRPPSPEGLLAFGNRSFAPSALNPSLAPPTKIPAPLAPKHKILEPPLDKTDQLHTWHTPLYCDTDNICFNMHITIKDIIFDGYVHIKTYIDISPN